MGFLIPNGINKWDKTYFVSPFCVLYHGIFWNRTKVCYSFVDIFSWLDFSVSVLSRSVLI